MSIMFRCLECALNSTIINLYQINSISAAFLKLHTKTPDIIFEEIATSICDCIAIIALLFLSRMSDLFVVIINEKRALEEYKSTDFVLFFDVVVMNRRIPNHNKLRQAWYSDYTRIMRVT